MNNFSSQILDAMFESAHSIIITTPPDSTIRTDSIVEQDEELSCCCQSQKNQKVCLICTGKGRVSRQNNFAKFVESILLFKIGQVQKRERTPMSNKSAFSNTCSFEPLRTSEKSNRSCLERPKDQHKGYECDNCKQNPITGTRYSCKVCLLNYDLCETCFSVRDHQHKDFEMAQISTEARRKEYMKQNMSRTVRLGDKENQHKYLRI